MNRITLLRIKNVFINIAVVLTTLIGIESILIGYNRSLEVLNGICNYSGLINPEYMQIHRTVSIIIGFVIIFISFRLYKRMRTAWIISLGMSSLLVFMHVFKSGNIFSPTIIFQLAALGILTVNYKSFKKRSDPISLRTGILIGVFVVVIVVLNICITIFALKINFSNPNGIYNVISSILQMLFLIDISVLGHLSKTEIVFAKSAIAINWIGIISALIFVLKPLIYQPGVTRFENEKVRKLLKKYGNNPVSYVSLGDDKRYYFGKETEGVIAFVLAAGVAVCVGDPICSDESLPMLIIEFKNYCKQNDFGLCFCCTLEKNISLYTKFGFSSIKCGEEAMFDLENYNLAGRKAAKIRNAINHAATLGIRVLEYKPLEHKEKCIEQNMSDISKEWLYSKKSSELSFMLGTTSLDNPMDRRYFAAYDKDDNMLGFIVFSPFASGQGYYADVTRRKKDAPIGVMEKITIEAFQKMKLEGVKWGSLGLAPLANISEDGKITGRLLDFFYEKLNNFYGFKTLHHYKKKYGCTAWEPRYFVYYGKRFTPKIAYSIIKAQNPKGVSDFILIQLKSIFEEKGIRILFR